VFNIYIWKVWAHQCPPSRLDEFKFRLCCHYWNTYEEL